MSGSEREHTIPEKRYDCPQCPKTYSRRDYLERHLLNHQRPAKACDDCGKTFSRDDVLRRHRLQTCGIAKRKTIGLAVGKDSRDPEAGHKKRRVTRKPLPPDGGVNEDSSVVFPHPISAMLPNNIDHDHQMSNTSEDTVRDDRLGSLWPPLPAHADTDNAPSGDLVDLASVTSFGSSLWAVPELSWMGSTSYQPPGHTEMVSRRGSAGDCHKLGQSSDNLEGLFSWLFNSSPERDENEVSASRASTSAGVINREAVLTSTESISVDPDLYLNDPYLISQIHLQAKFPHPFSNILPNRVVTQTARTLDARLVPDFSFNRGQATFPDGWASRPWNMPEAQEILNEAIRAQILSFFQGEVHGPLSSPVFDLARMKIYFELYFIHFAPIYPIVHRPSLQYRQVMPDLLLAIICIGSAFADDRSGFEIATLIFKRVRTRIFEVVEDEPRPPLHSLQALLLINYFSRTYCSEKQHDVAQVFHSTSMILSRLSGLFLPHFTIPLHVEDHPLSYWKDWVLEEERKRLGWFAFLTDSENVALYRGYLQMHCFKIQIAFPSDDSTWHAPDPIQWDKALRQAIPPESFRNSMRGLAGQNMLVPNLSDFSLWIMLHGLISISWSLMWRDMGEMSMVSKSDITRWKESLRKAFDAWRAHVNPFRADGGSMIQQGSRESIGWNGSILTHLGCILVFTDTEQIRIFAGATNVAGRSIYPGEWWAAEAYVKLWARSDDALQSCRAAAELLVDIFRRRLDFNFQAATNILPVCSYVASLVIWAYSIAVDGPISLEAPYVVPSNRDTTTGHLSVKIESTLARIDAIAYLDRWLACESTSEFRDMKNKNRCSGVLAYSACIAGSFGRGILEENKKVLERILTEHI